MATTLPAEYEHGDAAGQTAEGSQRSRPAWWSIPPGLIEPVATGTER